MASPPVITCGRCGYKIVAFSISWHLYIHHSVIQNSTEYSRMFWRAVRGENVVV